MPGKYSIKIDTTVPPVQHARRKVPIHYKEEIERKLLEMEQLQIIAPVTQHLQDGSHPLLTQQNKMVPSGYA